MQFQLSLKQTQAIEYLEDGITTELFYGGGAGSGKSYFGCYWHIKRRLKYPRTRGLIGRSELKILNESTLITFFKVCQTLGLEAGGHYKYNRNSNTINWFNGSRTILMDLNYYPSDPDYHRFGSTEYTDVFIDEATEVDEKCFDILNSRVRWMLKEYGLKPKALLTGNAGDHWIKKKYIKDENDTPITLKPHQKVVRGTVRDNLDHDFAEIYLTQLALISNDYDRERLMNDDWDIMPRTGKEYYHLFNSLRHVTNPQYNPNEPLHVTYDFNVNPYMTLEVAQISNHEGRYKVKFIDEFCLTHPLNKTRSVSEALLKKYHDDLGHRAGLFYYGDSTSRKGNTMSEEELEHDFSVVEVALWKMLNNSSNRVINNPPVLNRRDFMLMILEGKTIIDIEIADKCVQLKKDFLYLKQGADGKKHKEPARDPVTNATYQKYGHASDAAEYLICSAFYDYMQSLIRQ